MSEGLERVTVRVPATTANLGPAFDCMGLALGLYNEITVALGEGIAVSVSGEGSAQLPDGEQNMVVKAARYLSQYAGRHLPGLRVWQKNGVPVGSGLGSSAAAVVGGLLGANALLETGFSPEILLRLATLQEGHADNAAAAIYGGLVLANKIEGTVQVQKIPLPTLQLIVVLPHVSLPTYQARAALPAQVPFADASFNAGRSALLVWALSQGNVAQLRAAMEDRLHQPYRLPLIPGMEDAFAVARAAGAAVALSGAGPSLVAVAAGDREQLAQNLCAAFSQAGVDSRYWILPVANEGATVTRAP